MAEIKNKKDLKERLAQTIAQGLVFMGDVQAYKGLKTNFNGNGTGHNSDLIMNGLSKKKHAERLFDILLEFPDLSEEEKKSVIEDAMRLAARGLGMFHIHENGAPATHREL